jgi:hemoglobin-like flavoprotein
MHRLFPIEMAQEKRKLLEALVLVVKSLRRPDVLPAALTELGRRHTHWDTTGEQFPIFCNALVSVMAEVAGDRWNDQFTQDWTTLLELAASAVLEGHQVEARAMSTAPA